MRVLFSPLKILICLLALAFIFSCQRGESPPLGDSPPPKKEKINSSLNLRNDEQIEEKKSEAEYLNLIKASPEDRESMVSLGNLYLEKHDYDRAAEMFTTAIKADKYLGTQGSVRSEPHQGLAEIYKEKREYEKAVQEAGIALALDPEASAPHVILGEIYFLRGDLKKAREMLEPYMSDQEACVLLARIYSITGDSTRALKIFKDLLENKYPDPEEIYNQIGDLYRKNGDFEESISFYKKALDYPEKKVEALCSLGSVYLLDLDDVKDAEDAFSQAEKTSPENEYVILGLAEINCAKGDFQKSESLYKKAILLYPRNPDAHLCLSEVYRKQKDFTREEEEIGKALKLVPHNPRAYLGMGRALMEQGNLKAAEDALKKARRFSGNLTEPLPSTADLDLAFGDLYLSMGKDRDAKTEYKKALAGTAGEGVISDFGNYGLAIIAARNKSYLLSVRYLESCIKNPKVKKSVMEKMDKEFGAMKSMPEFQELVKKN